MIPVGLRVDLLKGHVPLPFRPAGAGGPHLIAGLAWLIDGDQQWTVSREGGLEGTIGRERRLPDHRQAAV